ncbi:MAG: hypothetical protein ACI8TQ_001484 [Planctomycetota bacterium]|jgi:hypothetical protein
MNTKQIYLSTLCALTLATSLAAQDDSKSDDFIKAYDRSELTLVYHDSKLADTTSLIKMIDKLYGRNILVRSNDGSRIKSVDNLYRYGKAIVIYETAEGSAELQKALKELEAVALQAMRKEEEKQRRLNNAAQQEKEAQIAVSEAITSFTYSPRFISDRALKHSLDLYARFVQFTDSDGTPRTTKNMLVTDSPTTLVVRDTQSNIDKMVALLQEIDRPLPQITLSAYLLSPTDFDIAPDPPSLPKELSQNLAKLTPYEGFGQLAMSSIRTSVGTGNETLLTMKGNGLHFSLELDGLKYDEQSGTLAITSASLYRHNTTMTSPTGPIPPAVELQTSFSTVEGEYAVIGLTGIKEKTILLAVQFQAIASPKKSMK